MYGKASWQVDWETTLLRIADDCMVWHMGGGTVRAEGDPEEDNVGSQLVVEHVSRGETLGKPSMEHDAGHVMDKGHDPHSSGLEREIGDVLEVERMQLDYTDDRGTLSLGGDSVPNKPVAPASRALARLTGIEPCLSMEFTYDPPELVVAMTRTPVSPTCSGVTGPKRVDEKEVTSKNALEEMAKNRGPLYDEWRARVNSEVQRQDSNYRLNNIASGSRGHGGRNSVGKRLLAALEVQKIENSEKWYDDLVKCYNTGIRPEMAIWGGDARPRWVWALIDLADAERMIIREPCDPHPIEKSRSSWALERRLGNIREWAELEEARERSERYKQKELAFFGPDRVRQMEEERRRK